MEMQIKEYIEKNYIKKDTVIKELEKSIEYYKEQIKEWINYHDGDLSGTAVMCFMNNCDACIKELEYLIEKFKEDTNDKQ